MDRNVFAIIYTSVFLHGVISTCLPKFWGPHCTMPCSDNCTEDGCNFLTGNCHKCQPGSYGPKCQQDCSLCKNSQCTFRECALGCKDGYLQDVGGAFSICRPCPPLCAKCSSISFCTQCYNGYYIDRYAQNKIPNQPSNASSCLKCSSDVPRCVECIYKQNQVVCDRCEEDYVVKDNQCVSSPPCTNCENGCKNDSICVGGCKAGWTGTKCNVNCHFACETCWNQSECLTCRGDFYTKACNKPCSTNCRSGNNTYKCAFNDGYCLFGCNKGFWGDQCENSCNINCLNISAQSECYRNGTCSFGCKQGYIGPDCSEISPFLTSQVSSGSTSQGLSTTKTMVTATDKTSLFFYTAEARSPETVTSKTDQVPVVVIFGGAGGGAVLVVVVIVVLIWLIWRRRRNDNEEHKALTPCNVKTFNPAFTPVSSRQTESHQPQQTDYIYAQPNKPKKQSVNTELTGNPQTKTNSSIEIDMNDRDAGEENDTDALEDLDDGEANVPGAGEKGEIIRDLCITGGHL